MLMYSLWFYVYEASSYSSPCYSSFLLVILHLCFVYSSSGVKGWNSFHATSAFVFLTSEECDMSMFLKKNASVSVIVIFQSFLHILFTRNHWRCQVVFFVKDAVSVVFGSYCYLLFVFSFIFFFSPMFLATGPVPVNTIETKLKQS